jgi:hypothetical protein
MLYPEHFTSKGALRVAALPGRTRKEPRVLAPFAHKKSPIGSPKAPHQTDTRWSTYLISYHLAVAGFRPKRARVHPSEVRLQQVERGHLYREGLHGRDAHSVRDDHRHDRRAGVSALPCSLFPLLSFIDMYNLALRNSSDRGTGIRRRVEV